jgi:hypothetical protein
MDHRKENTKGRASARTRKPRAKDSAKTVSAEDTSKPTTKENAKTVSAEDASKPTTKENAKTVSAEAPEKAKAFKKADACGELDATMRCSVASLNSVAPVSDIFIQGTCPLDERSGLCIPDSPCFTRPKKRHKAAAAGPSEPWILPSSRRPVIDDAPPLCELRRLTESSRRPVTVDVPLLCELRRLTESIDDGQNRVLLPSPRSVLRPPPHPPLFGEDGFHLLFSC